MKRRAFTLVELLVVIGIIAVLIAILLPVLSGSRRTAVRTTCASQLRQIAIACQMYANENKGYLPEFGHGYRTNPAISVSFDPPQALLQNFNMTSFNWRVYNVNLDHGLGRLLYRRYLSDPKILMCPAMPSVLNMGAGTGTQRAPYFFNPHPAWYLTEGGKVGTRYKKLADYRDTTRRSAPSPGGILYKGPPRALACDVIYDQGTMVHSNPKKLLGGINLVYSDGSVAMPNSKEAWGRLNGLSTDWAWNRTSDVIGVFEYIADGRPPDLSMGGSVWSNSCSNYDPMSPPITKW